MTVRLDLGDGRYIEQDMPPPKVAAAMLRVKAALEGGHEPRQRDMATVMDWIDAQDRKYGSGPARW